MALTKAQAHRLRGLIARHSRCQWNMGAVQYERGPSTLELVATANRAREALYAEIRAITEEKENEPA
jgi:hypothetical protein